MKNYILLIFTLLISESILAQSEKPNIILIFCDDLGYADLGVYGSVWNQTPELDKMTTEGVKFTNFYAGAPVCTPSRAGLLTGSYARRVDLDLDAQNRWVLFPQAKKGMNPQEVTVAEALQEGGYATAIIGKWHLGDQPVFFPTRHGFDYWFGIPYSNDMEWDKRNDPPLPLMENEKVFQQEEKLKAFDQSTLTKRYTEKAIDWIEKNKKEPFFLYFAHAMPHNPVAATNSFLSKTVNPKNTFGAAVAEISWSAGEIINYLKKENLDENTLVIFTSDNGGAPRFGAHNGILKGHKGQTNEGGIRVPMIAWQPGTISAGSTCHAPASVIDFFHTFTSLAGVKIQDGKRRDGADITDYLINPMKNRKERPFFYWHSGYLEAIRFGDWKLHLMGNFSRKIQEKPALYNLKNDPAESEDVASDHPEIVKQLTTLAIQHKSELGEWDNKGPAVRSTIKIENPQPIYK